MSGTDDPLAATPDGPDDPDRKGGGDDPSPFDLLDLGDDADATLVTRPPAPRPATPPRDAVGAVPFELPDLGDDPDATFVARPPPPAAPPAPAGANPFDEPAAAEAPPPPPPRPEIPALRGDVLRGHFFTAAAARVAERLADFVSGTTTDQLGAWFGRDLAETLARDPKRLRGMLDRDIAAIDAMLSRQVDAMLHHPRFRKLEGTWRGIRWLLGRIDPGPRVRIRVLQMPWSEVVRDLERAAEFDQSQLFRKVYEEEFGQAGGEPYGLLIVDHEVRHRPGPGALTDDVSALSQLSGIAAASFVPTVISASPALLSVDRFADLALVPDISEPFRGPEYTRWRSLAGKEDTRFLAVTMPRVLVRAPHADNGVRARPWRYAEARGPQAGRCWITAGYAFAAIAARAFLAHGWPADVRGVDQDRIGGGLVTEIPLDNYTTDKPGIAPRPVLDVALTDRQERALVDAGLMPLSSLHMVTEALFSAARSLQQPKRYQGENAPMADANARLSAQFSAMLCVSRFAHYIKVLGRDMLGAYRTPEDVQSRLQTWLTTYVNARPGSSADLRARYPLVGGKIEVKEKPGAPGVYGCVVHLQPHFQLDDMSASFRLVTEFVGKPA